jgi:hypothetical protein
MSIYNNTGDMTNKSRRVLHKALPVPFGDRRRLTYEKAKTNYYAGYVLLTDGQFC